MNQERGLELEDDSGGDSGGGPYTQAHRPLAVGTPLGEDVLLLQTCQLREELGRPFAMQLELRSENYEIAYDDIVGHNVTVRIQLLTGATRYINGFVSSFTQRRASGGLAEYSASVVPWLWFLTRTGGCRIFQEMSIPSIVKQVFQDRGFSDFEDELNVSYDTLEYCVQYRESDFNFVSRLMEEAGIYYYFRHEQEHHYVVLSDSPANHSPFAGYDTIRYRPPSEERQDTGCVRDWATSTTVLTGRYALNDFDFKAPNKNLRVNRDIARPNAVPDFEMYDYPGSYFQYAAGEELARVRIEEIQCRYRVRSGEGDSRGIIPGHTFTLADFVREDENRGYLVVSADTVFDGGDFGTAGDDEGDFCSCSFEAIPDNEPFRAARITPCPHVRGPQTAIVVGPEGEEIHTDDYGRVKVQFHWDREGERNQDSSCWIRVAQLWAGRRWGAVFLPRIGQEVIVDFLEGDPDQPIITGRVYNGANMPPYELPAEKTKSTIKSNSSKEGDGFNEIRFEDAKGDEQVFIHAQRNMDTRVRNDSKERVIGNLHSVVGAEEDGSKSGDRFDMIYRDKHLKVHQNETTQIGGTRRTLIGDIDGPGDDHLVVRNDRYELIENESHVHVKSNRNETIDGTLSETIGGDRQAKVGMNDAVDAGMEIHLKAGLKVVIEGGLQVTLKGPGGFVDIGPSGVTIQGNMVLINSGGAAGAGSGASPAAARDAEEALPEEPALADNAVAGQVDDTSGTSTQVAAAAVGAAGVSELSGDETQEEEQEPGPTLTVRWEKQHVTPDHNSSWPPASPPTDTVPAESKTKMLADTTDVPDDTNASIVVKHCGTGARIRAFRGLKVSGDRVVDPETGQPPEMVFTADETPWDPWNVPFFCFEARVEYRGLSAETPSDHEAQESQCLRVDYWHVCLCDARADRRDGLTTQAEMGEIAGILGGESHHRVYQRSFNSRTVATNLWGSALRNTYVYHQASHGDVVDRTTGRQLRDGHNPSPAAVNNWQSVICFGNTRFGDGEASDRDSVPFAPRYLAYLNICVAGWEPSLADAFLARGTRNVLAFRMSIPDGDARQMARDFYNRWVGTFHADPEKIPDVFFQYGPTYYRTMRPVLFGEGGGRITSSERTARSAVGSALSGTGTDASSLLSGGES